MVLPLGLEDPFPFAKNSLISGVIPFEKPPVYSIRHRLERCFARVAFEIFPTHSFRIPVFQTYLSLLFFKVPKWNVLGGRRGSGF